MTPLEQAVDQFVRDNWPALVVLVFCLLLLVGALVDNSMKLAQERRARGRRALVNWVAELKKQERLSANRPPCGGVNQRFRLRPR